MSATPGSIQTPMENSTENFIAASDAPQSNPISPESLSISLHHLHMNDGASTSQNIGGSRNQLIDVTSLPSNNIGFEIPAPLNPEIYGNAGDHLGLDQLFSMPSFEYQRPRVLKIEEIMMLATNKEGSLDLQSRLSPADPASTMMIFQGVLGSIFRLMTDPYGSRVFMKLVEVCSPTQLQIITQLLNQQQVRFINASLDLSGSRSICWLIKRMERTTLAATLMDAICWDFYLLMTNQNGSKVVLKCVEVLPEPQAELLYRTAIKECVEVAIHSRGCVSLKTFIEHVRGPLRDELLLKIADYSMYLAQDPYGNYVVQNVLGLFHPRITMRICSALTGHYVELSMKKVGSHVVEKCLESWGMKLVIEDLLRSSQLLQVARHQYGNYVVQTAFRVTQERSLGDYQRLVMKLRPHLEALQNGYGRNVFLKLTATDAHEEAA